MSGSKASVPAPLYGERIIAADESVDGIARRIAGPVLEPPGGSLRRIVAAVGCGLLCIGAVAVARDGSSLDASLVGAACRDWWIGLAHGSLLLSAVLLLLGVEWRCAVCRIAETLALLATVAAGFCGALGSGGPQPIGPGRAAPVPPFGAAAVWDEAGFVCFVLVCLTYWSIGLLPDLAVLRDRAALSARTLPARIYGTLAWGWRGSAVQWQRWIEAYRAIALLGILLVVVLQTAASVRLAGAAPTDRTDTLLPITVLVGAVFSGVGGTAALTVAIRHAYGLGGLVTRRHLDILARTLLVLGLAGLYCHLVEILSALLHGDAAARAVVTRGIGGDLAWLFWPIAACGLLPVQVFWLPRARRSAALVATVGLLAVVAAFADRAMILAASRAETPSPLDGAGLEGVAFFAGSLGLVLTLLLLGLRVLPIVSIAQTRELAVAHNGAAALAGDGPAAPGEAEPGRGAPHGRIEAVFASEAALAGAARVLLVRDRTLRLEALGPVPMPGVLDLLPPSEPAIRHAALAGALIGGSGFLALCLSRMFGDDPQWREAWPALVTTSLSVAMVAGTLAVLLALVASNRPALRGLPRAGHDRYRLVVETGDGDAAVRLERQLAALRSDRAGPPVIREPTR